jgi:RNA polymerase sigma-70 factor (ECF subfamily)
MLDDGQEDWIAAGLRAGNADAWRTLHDAYAGEVWRWVARSVGPHPADVADVVQEAMLAAARSARRFDASRGTLRQWLWGLVRIQVQLHFRNRQRHERWRQLRPVHTTAPPDDDDAEQVRLTLAELPGDYDALLTAKYLDGDAVETIAKREGLTPTAVRSKLARAREAFRRAFEKFRHPVK